MIPNYLKPSSSTRLKPCQERMVGTCDVVPADGCCGVIPCRLCLEWETYTGIEYGSADFATSSWTGTVGGNAFVSYWQRNEAGECEYIVTFGGYEVYRATCYEGASCRNPSGEASATVGTESGTLRWSVYEPRELELIDDPATGCRDFFCDSCRCSCDCLCVTITEYGGDVFRGEICDIAYQCDPPTWAGTVGYYDLSFTLGRDEYGNCIITPTVDGVELDAVAAPGCGSMAATITTAEGHVISVFCKVCTCDETALRCCSNRDCPGPGAVNPMPDQLTMEMTASFAGPPSVSPPGSGIDPPENSDCFNFSFTLNLSVCADGIITYAGEGENTCTWCGTTYTMRVSVILTCGVAGQGWILTFEAMTTPGDCNLDFSGDQYSINFEQTACDPILLSGDANQCFDCVLTCQIGAIIIPPGVLVPVIATHAPFCISAMVYETP